MLPHSPTALENVQEVDSTKWNIQYVCAIHFKAPCHKTFSNGGPIIQLHSLVILALVGAGNKFIWLVCHWVMFRCPKF